MTWADFWRSLERKAMPHIQAEVEKRGWKLIAVGAHFFEASRARAVWMESGDGPYVPHVTASTASDLLKKIEHEESLIRKSLAGLEIAFAERVP